MAARAASRVRRTGRGSPSRRSACNDTESLPSPLVFHSHVLSASRVHSDRGSFAVDEVHRVQRRTRLRHVVDRWHRSANQSISTTAKVTKKVLADLRRSTRFIPAPSTGSSGVRSCQSGRSSCKATITASTGVRPSASTSSAWGQGSQRNAGLTGSPTRQRRPAAALSVVVQSRAASCRLDVRNESRSA